MIFTEVNESKVDDFFKEMKAIGLDVGGEAHSYRKHLVNISYKIMNQCDPPEGLSKKDQQGCKDCLVMDIGCCLHEPDYWIHLGTWCDDDGNAIKEGNTYYMMWVRHLIGTCLDLLTQDEQNVLGDRIEFFQNHFPR